MLYETTERGHREYGSGDAVLIGADAVLIGGEEVRGCGLGYSGVSSSATLMGGAWAPLDATWSWGMYGGFGRGRGAAGKSHPSPRQVLASVLEVPAAAAAATDDTVDVFARTL